MPGPPKGVPKAPGSGRKKGTPNKTLVEIRALAQVHVPKAIERLGQILADDAKPWQAWVAAATKLLEYGYGRPGELHDQPQLPGVSRPVNLNVLAELQSALERCAALEAEAVGQGWTRPTKPN